MTDFIVCILVSSLWIWGVNCLFSEDQLLETWGEWMFVNLPEWVYKPTVGCAACMASVHGLLWFFIGFPIGFGEHMPIRLLIPFLISLCGFNFLLIKLTSKERVIVEDE